jgi:hypothetical protein
MDDSEDVAVALLGPAPSEPPMENDQDPDFMHPETWPHENDAPHGLMFVHRWNQRDLDTYGATVQAGRDLRRQRLRTLQSGEIKTVAFDRVSGRTIEIPVEAWAATGEGGKLLWWSGAYSVEQSEGWVRWPVYVVDPPAPPLTSATVRAPAAVAGQDEELSPRERSSVAKIIATLVLRHRRGFHHGLAAELEREAEAQGHPVSDDTIRQWLRRGEASYDPEKDTRPKR